MEITGTDLMKRVSYINGDPSTPRSAIDEQLRIADEMMKRILDHSLPLKSARNALAPISRLPVELLSLVFQIYIHDPELRKSEDDEKYVNPQLVATIKWVDIMRITRVCRVWRSVALDCPSFWSQVVFSSPDAAAMMLERSRGTPLFVRVLGPHLPEKMLETESSIFESIDMRVDRIQELHLSLPDHIQNAFLLNISSSPVKEAKQLQSLYLYGGTRPEYTRGFRDLFSISMPNLQHLRLDDIKIRWDYLHDAATGLGFPRLISLKVHCSFEPCAIYFYGVLAAAPNLEDLNIDFLPSFTSKDTWQPHPGPIDTISLPKLSSIKITRVNISRWVEFHSNVSYPTTTAKLHFQLCSAKDHDNEASMKKLLTVCGLSEESRTRSHSHLLLDIYGYHAQGMRAALWDAREDDVPQQIADWECDQPSVVLDLTHYSYPDIIPCDFSPLLHKHLCVSGLRWVGITQNRIGLYGQEDWRSFFKRHPDMASLHIATDFVYEIILALIPLEADHYDEAAPPTLEPSSFCLPNLDLLTLEDHGVKLDDYKDEYRDEIAASIPDMMSAEMNAIVCSLGIRHKNGFKLREICFAFAREGWTLGEFYRLGGFVMRVNWMGLPPYLVGRYDESDEEDDVDEDRGEGEPKDDDDDDEEEEEVSKRVLAMKKRLIWNAESDSVPTLICDMSCCT